MRKENEEEFFNLAQLKKEIEKLMKTLISLVLTFIMSLTSTSIFWTSVDFEKLNSVDSGVKETPVAYIENDDYVPYQYRNYTQDDTTTREYLDFNLNTEFETVFKTITVMTTATGDPKRGNYVASKPIADALVRVDGVPRYTDSKGQITAPLNREYVELYVEYSGYNPYIEIIEATEEQKTVYLKQPSDDIEIIDVMFNLQGYVFNIMLQPCYYLKGQMETAALLEVHSNVEYDYILFYVNGQLDRIGFDDILFTEDDLNDYDVDDEFAVSISYNGIDSKLVELNLRIEVFDGSDMKAQMKSALIDNCDYNLGTEMDDPLGIGSIGAVTVGKTQILELILESIFFADPEDNWSFNVDIGVLSFSFTFDRYSGTIKFLGGLKFDLKKPIMNKLKKDAANGKNDYKNAAKNSGQQQAEEDAFDAISDYNEKLGNYNNLKEQENVAKEVMDKAKQELEAAEERKAQGQSWKKSDGYRTFRDEQGRFISTIDGLTKEYSAAQEQYNKIHNTVENLSNTLDNPVDNTPSANSQSGPSKFQTILDYLTNIDGITNQIQKLKNFFDSGSLGTPGFDWSLDFSVLASIESSYRTGELLHFSVYTELSFKPSYTWIFTVSLPPVIPVLPMFVTIQGDLHAKAETIMVDDKNGVNLTFAEALKQIEILIGFYVRVDFAAGLKGVFSGGLFGKIGLDMYFSPEIKAKFIWDVGFKAQFLMFEREFSIKPAAIIIDEKGFHVEGADNYSLLSRVKSNTVNISDNQLFDRMYQSSQPQMIKLNDGRSILFWIEDDIERDDYNRYVLKYSILNNDIWSQPQAVINDGMADYDYDVYSDGIDVYVAIQRTNRIITEYDQMDNVIETLDIFVAKFNNSDNVFGDIVQITNDDSYQSNPQFAVSSSEVVLTWRTNTQNDYFGLTGENLICSTTLLNGNWGDIKERYRNSAMLYNYSSAFDDGNFTLAVCETLDGSVLASDTVLRVTKNQSEVFVKEKVMNAKFISLPSGMSLLYSDEENLKVTSDFVNINTVVSNFASQNFNIGKTSDIPTIFYDSYDGNLSKGYCALYLDGDWVENIVVTDEIKEDYVISALTGYYEDGVIYSAYNYNKQDSEDLDAGIALCVANHDMGYKIYTEAYTSERVIDGIQSDIRLYVKNVGDFVIKKFKVKICNQDFEIVCNQALRIGEGKYFTVSFIPHLNESSYLTVTTVIEGRDEVELAKDECKILVKYTDLDVDFSRNISNGKQHFEVSIKNVSDIDTSFDITVYVNGEINRKMSRKLNAFDECMYDLTFDEIAEGDYIFIEVVAMEKEFSIIDNSKGYYSLRTEKLQPPEVENPYQNILKNIKALVS